MNEPQAQMYAYEYDCKQWNCSDSSAIDNTGAHTDTDKKKGMDIKNLEIPLLVWWLSKSALHANHEPPLMQTSTVLQHHITKKKFKRFLKEIYQM